MADQNVIELLLKVHAGLAKLVAPATPETLRATQPPPGRQRLLGGMPLIIKGTILAALISLIGFLCTVPKPKDTSSSETTATSPAKTHAKPKPSATSTATVSPPPAPTEKQP